MMHDCADATIRDLLPGYVHATLPAPDRDRVATHVASCEDCAAEVELIRAASRAFPAPVVDVARIVAALSPRRPARHGRRGQQWRIAAAVGFVAVGALSAVVLKRTFDRAADEHRAPQVAVTSAGGAVASAPGTAAESASTGSVGMSFGDGLSDLTEDQLQTLLRDIDTIDGKPSPEPEQHATPIIPSRQGGDSA